MLQLWTRRGSGTGATMTDADEFHQPAPAGEPSPAPSLRGIVVYTVVVVALGWLVALPLWLGGGLGSPAFTPVATVMMFTPTLSALLVARFVDHRPVGAALGARPTTSAVRTMAWSALALGVIAALVLGCYLSSWALGTFQVDLVGMSAFRELLDQQLSEAHLDPIDMPMRLLWALQFINIAVACAVNAVVAAGEELGWRGYLFPALRARFGVVAAVLGTGVIWGLWHAPLILLGYNYPDNPVLGLVFMVIMCTGVGAVLSWLVDRGGSAWPAAIGHGTLNATVSAFAVMFGAAGAPLDTFRASIMGWGGWPVLVVAAVLAIWAIGRRR